MNIFLKCFITITILLAITNPAFANTPSNTAILFSPYADLTINTHWDSHYQDMEPTDLSLMSHVSGVRSYHLAFITDSGTCAPAWGGQASYDVKTSWGSHLTEKLTTNNINYIISFGGASGNDLSMACNETQLINTYNDIINTYHPQGLDFDIENGSANVPKIIRALQQIQNSHPNLQISFTLPVLPEGLTTSGQDVVNQAKVVNLNYAINIMAMDYGPAYVNDMGQYAIQAATNLFTFLKTLYPQKPDSALWQMIQVTPMIGVNDVNVENFTLTNVDTLRNFAKQNSLGSLSIWSVARDNPCADRWASPVCSGNNLQSTAYEFSERFLQL